MHPVYIRQIILKYHKISFSDYTNKIKIHESIKLIENGNFKLLEISKKLGYDNLKSFVSQFKKYTKISPDEYKLKFKNNMK